MQLKDLILPKKSILHHFDLIKLLYSLLKFNQLRVMFKSFQNYLFLLRKIIIFQDINFKK